jgi:hypothetical protein
MKKEDLLLLLGVGLGVFAVARFLSSRTKNTPAKSTYVPPSYVSEVTRADGWTYYSDGTVIGPDGKYYFKGDEVYNPAGMYQ